MQVQMATLFILCTQIAVVYGGGNLFIGLLGYTNENSACCERNNCIDFTVCNVSFEVMIDNLNSSLPAKRPTEIPLTLTQAESFTSNHITNPLSFNFYHWPGSVNLTVFVYNGSSDTVIDEFETEIALYDSSDYYYLKTLSDDMNNSSMLSVVFRYVCDATKGPSCFSDCLDHDENETCPSQPPTTPLAVDLITYTGFKDPQCEITDPEGNVILSNCSGTTASSIESTAFPSNETNTTSLITTIATSSTSEYSSTTTDEPSTLSSTLESTPKTNTMKSTTIAEQKITTKTTKATKRNSIIETHASPPQQTMTVTNSVSTVYPRDGNAQSVDVNTAYWPAIVGGVLGGVALFAATAFMCYWNRQKKLQKRQEIYNVNPKILRNFEEFEENGTSGRSDVPMETEQY